MNGLGRAAKNVDGRPDRSPVAGQLWCRKPWSRPRKKKGGGNLQGNKSSMKKTCILHPQRVGSSRGVLDASTEKKLGRGIPRELISSDMLEALNLITSPKNGNIERNYGGRSAEWTNPL